MNEGIYASERSAQINRDRFDHYCVSNSRGRKRALPPFFCFHRLRILEATVPCTTGSPLSHRNEAAKRLSSECAHHRQTLVAEVAETSCYKGASLGSRLPSMPRLT